MDGRVVVITGASSGLGERFARVLSGVGARLVLTARRTDRIEALADELPDALAVSVDVADDDGPQNLVDATVEEDDEAQALGLVDDIIVQGPPAGAPAKLLSKPVARAIERLPADHALRDMLRKLKEDPGYVRQLSEPTREARSAAARDAWDRKPAAKKKKEVGSCVEIKIRAPHAIDAM